MATRISRSDSMRERVLVTVAAGFIDWKPRIPLPKAFDTTVVYVRRLLNVHTA